MVIGHWTWAAGGVVKIMIHFRIDVDIIETRFVIPFDLVSLLREMMEGSNWL